MSALFAKFEVKTHTKRNKKIQNIFQNSEKEYFPFPGPNHQAVKIVVPNEHICISMYSICYLVLCV
jgi:hypothetical protein